MISAKPQALSEIIHEMDKALEDEIKFQQSNNPPKYIAINGKLLSEQSGNYLYEFSLEAPWEPQDDTPLEVRINSTKRITGTLVTSQGMSIRISTEEPLPLEALRKVDLINNPTQLLEQLRKALKSNKEGASELGSKSFGLKPSTSNRRPSPLTFEGFNPYPSQKLAIQTSLGSEVTYIIGPPGTGKTITLAAMAFTHMREGRTVLITAHTNIAVDNAIKSLAELCQKAGAVNELREGFVLRYGTPQHKSLREDNKYKDVNLDKVAAQRAQGLQQQHEKFQDDLKQIGNEREAINQTKQQSQEQWQMKQQQFVAQRDNCQNELARLVEKERQRLEPLDAQLLHTANQLNQAHLQLETVRQELSHLTNIRGQKQATCYEYSKQSDDLNSRLIEAQQMSSFKRFFKRINLEHIAQLLSELHYQQWTIKQHLIDIEKRIDVIHQARAVGESQYNHLLAIQRDLQVQRNAPSADARQIEILRTTIREYEQLLSQVQIGRDQGLAGLEQKHRKLQAEEERTREKIATIDDQMRDIKKRILAEARVVATTLSKTYMDSSMNERRFDVVIIDEVSMAPLPAVYVAASHADSSVVAIGDPNQLAPICNAKSSEYAKKWLDKDLFEVREITFKGAKRGYGNSVILQEQARMHPDISIIPNRYVYDRCIEDAQKVKSIDYSANFSEVKPLPGKHLLLCDTSDAKPIATCPGEKGRINMYHALCAVELAHQVINSLPENNAQESDTQHIGIVTPYAKQARLLQHLLKDARLDKKVRAGTVHKFQGLEFDVVIFDTVESPPVSPYDDFIAGSLRTNAKRLINVAVTRAMHKLIIVANAQHIQGLQGYNYFKEDSILRLTVQEAQKAGIINSREILRDGILSSKDTTSVPSHNLVYDQVSLQKNLSFAVPYDLKYFDDRTFFGNFLIDVRGAKEQIVIYSPFLTYPKVKELLPVLTEKQKQGVRILAFTKPAKEINWDTSQLNMELKQAGVIHQMLSNMHEKIVFIDEDILYIGSLNVLSHKNTTEIMLRLRSRRSVQEVLKMMNRSSARDATVDTMAKIPEQIGEDIILPCKTLPKIPPCKKCGATMVGRANSSTGEAFYSCENWPKTGCKSREDVSENHLMSIPQLANETCKNCRGQTRVKMNSSKNARIECAAPTPCGFRQSIKFVK